MRAVSKDFETSQLMGIKINRVISVTFVIGSFLAGVGSLLYFTNYTTVIQTSGAMPGLKAFVAAVFGGIGSVPRGCGGRVHHRHLREHHQGPGCDSHQGRPEQADAGADHLLRRVYLCAAHRDSDRQRRVCLAKRRPTRCEVSIMTNVQSVLRIKRPDRGVILTAVFLVLSMRWCLCWSRFCRDLHALTVLKKGANLRAGRGVDEPAQRLYRSVFTGPGGFHAHRGLHTTAS